jgi:hypothetical protein
MSYYEKYLKYKSKYLTLKSQQNFMKGGTMPGLLPDDEKELQTNSDFFGFNVKYIKEGFPQITSPETFYQNFITILTGPDPTTVPDPTKILTVDHTKKNIYVDAPFMFFLFPTFSVFLSSLLGKTITYMELFTEFMKRLDIACKEKGKKIVFIFENDEVLKGDFQKGTKRKSTLQILNREFSSLLNYDTYKNDIANVIPNMMAHLLTYYQKMILVFDGEADELTFVEAIKSNEPSTIVTVDGDLVISMLLRKRYDVNQELNDLNIVFLRTDTKNFPKFCVVTDKQVLTDKAEGELEIFGKPIPENKDFALKMFVSLMFISTDAGYGRKINLADMNKNITVINTPPEKKEDFESLYSAIVKKFIATLSVLCYGWGIEKEVKQMLTDIGCTYAGELIEILHEFANQQLLVSVEPYFAMRVIPELFKNLITTLEEEKDTFKRKFSDELRQLIDFEITASKYYKLCKQNNIHSSILLLNLYEPTGDFTKKIITQLYEAETPIGEDSFTLATISDNICSMSGEIFEKTNKILTGFFIKDKKFKNDSKMIYINKDYLDIINIKLESLQSDTLKLRPFDPKTQTENLKNFITNPDNYRKSETQDYPIIMHMYPPGDSQPAKTPGQGKSKGPPQGKSGQGKQKGQQGKQSAAEPSAAEPSAAEQSAAE